MLRRVLSTAFGLQRAALPAGSAAFATNVPQDYALTMKKADELSSPNITKPQPKEFGLCAGVPPEIYKRPARIFVSSKSASQSGYAKTLHGSSQSPQWRIAFDTTGKWENQLIGWTSSADALENVGRASLFFYTKEAAMEFCEKHGWDYSVDLPNERSTTRSPRTNAYGDNYSTKRGGIPNLGYLAKHENYYDIKQ